MHICLPNKQENSTTYAKRAKYFTKRKHYGPKLFMTFSYQEYSTFTISVFV